MEQLMNTIDLSGVYPEIILVSVALLILMLQSFDGRWKGFYGYLSLIGVIAAAALVAVCPDSLEVRSASYSFNGLWVVDNYSRFFKLIFLTGTGLTILISIRYLEYECLQRGEYFTLVLLSTVGMMVMASGVELMTIFLGIELMSISLYVLAGYARTRLISNESALKYFLLGSFATGFLLYGMTLIYGATGTTELKGILKATLAAGFQKQTLIIGMALLVIGFGFKIALVPFHMWTPDVYEGAPAPVTAFMSAGPKAAAFAALARVFMEALPSVQADWSMVIWVLAALTMSVGNVLALVQENIKRMLAYSSIAHAGYVMVGFLASGELGLTGILYYMLAYTLMNIGAFALIVVLAGKGEEKIKVSDYKGLGYNRPIAALAMSLFLFSLAGIPPTGGFIGKFYIFSAAVKAGYVGLALIGVINSVVSVYYYLRITVAMYMQPPEEGTQVGTEMVKLAPSVIVAILISAYGILSLGIFPSSYVALVKQTFLALQ